MQLEAIVGAVYLEAGFQTTAELLAVWFESRFAALSLDQAEKDAKSQLQEWLQAQKLPLPEYELLSVEGESHDQTFSVRLKLSVLENSIETTGTSRRGAEQSAAAEALAGIAQREDDQS